MQDRNPNIPAVSKKLYPPQWRKPLTTQRKFWNQLLELYDFQCIYTGEPLTTESFELDHYLPWTFVCHDQLWNLVPAQSEINLTKSNQLPLDEHFSRFVKTQHKALNLAYEKMKQRTWEKRVESFVTDLKVAEKELLDYQRLRKAYSRTLDPLVVLAKNQGFREWSGYRAESGVIDWEI